MRQSQQVLEWQTEAVVSKQRLLILRLLRNRFQPLPADLEATILAMDDLGHLDTWFDLASQAQSLADFRSTAKL